MGTGIAAGIPLIFENPERSVRNADRYFAKGFFENYALVKEEHKEMYIIKEDLLINNYKSFLEEFYALIEEDLHKETELTLETIPIANSLDQFKEVFDDGNRNMTVPFCYGFSSFSVLGCNCIKYWLFYSGSYKAYLEEYNTLLHFERVLAKTMNNPLAKTVKVGIFG